MFYISDLTKIHKSANPVLAKVWETGTLTYCGWGSHILWLGVQTDTASLVTDLESYQTFKRRYHSSNSTVLYLPII